MKLQAGSVLQGGKYLLDRDLDREGMGATFLATQTLLNQPVVIKTLDPNLQVTQSFAQLNARFTEQSRLLARHQHPSIVRVLDFFQEDNLSFLVMEFVPGKTLRERVTQEGNLSEVEAIHYIRQIASGLSVAHRGGLIHHNISPDAIIRKEGTNLGVLVGFGLGNEFEIASESNPFKPKNWNGNRFTFDLYSLSVTVYYLLTGETPPENLNLDRYPWMPPVKQAILRGISRDPEWQLQTIDDWLKLLPNTSLPLLATTVSNGAAPVQNGAKPAVLKTVAPTSNGSTAIKPAPVATVAVASKPSTMKSVTHSQPIGMSRHLPKFLGLTIAATAAMGLGFGFALRISAAKAPGTSILHPAQTFSEKEWKGTLTPTDGLSDIPVENQLGDFNERPATTAPLAPATEPLPINPVPSPELELPKVTSPITPIPKTRRSIAPAPIETAPPVEPSYAPEPEPLPQTSGETAPVPPAAAPISPAPPVTPAPKPNSVRETVPAPATSDPLPPQ